MCGCILVVVHARCFCVYPFSHVSKLVANGAVSWMNNCINYKV
jgi:hypothetical protein